MKGFAAEDLFAAWCRMHGCRVHQAGRERTPVRLKTGRLVYPPADIFDAFDGITLDASLLPIPAQRDTRPEATLWWQMTTEAGRAKRRASVEGFGGIEGTDRLAVIVCSDTLFHIEEYLGAGLWERRYAVSIDRPAVAAWSKRQSANRQAKKFIEKMAIRKEAT